MPKQEFTVRTAGMPPAVALRIPLLRVLRVLECFRESLVDLRDPFTKWDMGCYNSRVLKNQTPEKPALRGQGLSTPLAVDAALHNPVLGHPFAEHPCAEMGGAGQT